MVTAKVRFWILIAIVSISGFSQGMLLPLIAIILEGHGVSSTINGLHATGLYIGILLASPFMEKPLQKLGFRPIIVIGGALVFISLLLFPLWHSLWFWFILRVLIGIGDHMLHFGTQTWITTTVAKETRGRSIALYGLSFALGFALGPLMTRLIVIHEALPFIVSSLLTLFVWGLIFFVKNSWPTRDKQTIQSTSSFSRFVQAGKIAWVAMIPSFGYGFLEAALHGTFPIYGLRLGFDVKLLSILIPCFAIGSIITQFPLGMLSDRWGRKNVLTIVVFLGAVSFGFAALFETSLIALFITISLSGMLVGSLFSLGMSYMTDLLPNSLLPAGNILLGIVFSLGSISGPFFGGLFIQLLPGVSLFYLMVILLILILFALMIKKEQQAESIA